MVFYLSPSCPPIEKSYFSFILFIKNFALKDSLPYPYGYFLEPHNTNIVKFKSLKT